jgi:selenocysteine lyase/cysteine desulfurase
MRKRHGVEIVVIPNDEYGQFDMNLLQQKVNGKVKLIAVNHMPTNSGLVNPVEQIGEVARANNIYFLVDACQSIGHIPIDVEKIGCDFLSATGRKYLRGPRGTGFLYASNRVKDLEPIFLDLSSAEWQDAWTYSVRNDAKRFENWECNYAIRLGLNEAVKYAIKVGSQSIWERTKTLGSELRDALRSLKGVNVLDEGAELGGIVTFNVTGLKEATIKAALDERAINVAVAPWNAALLDMQEKGIESLIRASVHYYNTTLEIEYFVESLDQIIHES